MSNSVSRWDALRVWATAMVVVLCSALGWSTLHADDEMLLENLEHSSSVTQPAAPAGLVARGQASAEASNEPERPSKKQKRAAQKAASVPLAGSEAVPIKAPEALSIEPTPLPDPAIVDQADSPGAGAEAADEPWTTERTIALLTERAMAHGSAVYEVLAVARCETGYTFMPWRDNGYLRRGSLGEVGVGQWLPPVERNHWGRTPHWREHRYHILAGYLEGDPDAIWWDSDALAWSMGPAAPAGFKSGWSCWRMRGPWWFV